MISLNLRYVFVVFLLSLLAGAGTLWQVSKLDLSLAEPPLVSYQRTRGADQSKEAPVDSERLEKDLVLEKIEQGKEFLLRMEHPELHGFYKKYDALADSFEARLHTVYSASIIYTLLKVYDFDKDERIIAGVPLWTDFLLSRQSEAPETFGAFYYSYYFGEQEKEPRFVAGTAALSIFTLLDLYERTGETVYLSSARMAGDWLLSMKRPDGVMKADKEYENGQWVFDERESLLYNGQVLAAFSRLYLATGVGDYYLAGEKIAQHFLSRVEKEGCYLGDDYRIKNPISSAWLVMSLLDFYKAKEKTEYKTVIFQCASDLLVRQMEDGGWSGAYSTSGNGWLAEVMGEMYHFCQKEKGVECIRYKEALLGVIGWLMENTYSQENTANLPNPDMALGGLFWNQDNKYVRTDALCHGLNAYLLIVEEL